MDDFLDLESLYKHLDEKAIDYSYRKIAVHFQKLKDKLISEKKQDLAIQAQWEADFFNFCIYADELSPRLFFTKENGEPINYPNLERFNDAAYEYLVKRLESVSNPVLKARYAHILWFSPKKHGKYAKMAIDSYFELLKMHEIKDKENPERNFGDYVYNSLLNAYFLSRKIKDETKTSLAKSEIKRLIFHYGTKSKIFFRMKIDLINLMTKEKQVFGRDDFTGVVDLCVSYAKELGNNHQAIMVLEAGKQVDQRFNETSYEWENLIAEVFEQMMRSHLDNDKQLAVTFCLDALEHYRTAKNTAKVSELEQIYDKIKTQTKFKEIVVNVDLSKHIKECQKRAQEIAKLSSDGIIAFLATEKNILPQYEQAKNQARGILEKHPLQSIIPVNVIDERGHSTKHFKSKEELEYYQLLKQYRILLELTYLPYVNLIIIEAIKEGKLSLPILIEFLKKNCWYGNTLTRTVHTKQMPYNWLSMIAPSLNDYFIQIDYYLASGNSPNFVLCIDSLILKIEGLLRDLCNYSGITTFTYKQKNGKIYEEKSINALLYDERITRLFDDDELLLLKFVLIEKHGYNLRNKVAHSLVNYTDYNLNFASLLLLILLKLGQFSLTPQKEEKQNI